MASLRSTLSLSLSLTHTVPFLSSFFAKPNYTVELANEAMDAQRSWVTTSDDNHETQHTLDCFLQEQEAQPKTAPNRIDV